MKPILLDGIGAGFIFFIFALGAIFIITVIFIEAIVMRKMNYHPVFRRSLLHSAVANVLSLAAGFALTETDSDLFQLDNMAGLAVMFGVTLVVEFILLFLMNRTTPVKRTMGVCFVMNLVSYAIALLIILLK